MMNVVATSSLEEKICATQDDADMGKRKADRQGQCHKLYDLKLVDDLDSVAFSSFNSILPTVP